MRAYGIDDRFAGPIGAAETTWFGRPAVQWFEERGLTWRDAGIDPGADIQVCALFPIAPQGSYSSEFVQWLFSCAGRTLKNSRAIWQAMPRAIGARPIQARECGRLYDQRTRNRCKAIAAMSANHTSSPFFRMDLARAAELVAADPECLAPAIDRSDLLTPIESAKSAMFNAMVMRMRGETGWEQAERLAFERLAASLVKPEALRPCLSGR